MAQGKLEVLFLTLYPEPAASPRYRVTQFLPALEARGLCCTVAPAVSETIYRQSLDEQNRLRPARYHRHELGQRFRQIISAKKYDVVFLQKAVMSASVRGFDRLLRQRARRLLYDIDDAVHLEPPHGLRGPWRAKMQVKYGVSWARRTGCSQGIGGSWPKRSNAEATPGIFPRL
ncbi:MAG: hypothetical protein KJ052_15635 [Candidatus Hydrogenedentes bacterium]|nr:hypothetical protein [Candidatus Hydrogenedentota bacterium]